MKLLIIKNGHVFARTNDDTASESDKFELQLITDDEIPQYPTESAGKGKYYELDYNGDTLDWVLKDRPLTTEERVEQLQNDVNEIRYGWKVGEKVSAGDRRLYNSVWYECLQAHTTQADWTPDVAVSLWIKE